MTKTLLDAVSERGLLGHSGLLYYTLGVINHWHESNSIHPFSASSAQLATKRLNKRTRLRVILQPINAGEWRR